MQTKMLVGLSHERVSQTYHKWIEVLDALGVDYIISKLEPEIATQKANKVFRNAPYHCICRNTMLGQYIDLIERGADTLLVPTRDKEEGIMICDSTRQVPMELANVYGKQVKIINPILGDDLAERGRVLCKLARKLGKPEKENEMLSIWNEKYKRENLFLANGEKKDITILLVGRIDHYMDYTDCDSSLMKTLVHGLNINIITPSMIEIKKNYIIRDDIIQIGKVNHRYWDSKNIINAFYNGRDQFDGVLFIHDANCVISTEEIDYIISKIKKFNVPSYVLNFNVGTLASAETALEAFVDMIVLKKKNGVDNVG